MMANILFIGRGDPSLEPHWKALIDKGWHLIKETSQRRALEQAGEVQPHVIVVDGTSPRLSAEKLCRQLRQRAPGSAILLLLSAGVRKPDAPCDAVLLKPFTFRKLLTRLQALLKKQPARIVQAGGLRLDLSTRELTTPTAKHALTPKEFELMYYFMQHAGQVLTRKALMEAVWHTQFIEDTRTLDVHIRWLRQKIEADPSRPQRLCTLRGTGYILHTDRSESNGK